MFRDLPNGGYRLEHREPALLHEGDPSFDRQQYSYSTSEASRLLDGVMRAQHILFMRAFPPSDASELIADDYEALERMAEVFIEDISFSHTPPFQSEEVDRLAPMLGDEIELALHSQAL